jgi:hypothetical protein
MAITLSIHQETGWLWNATAAERQVTEQEGLRLVQLQGGVFFVANTEQVRRFFETWLVEWERWGQIDQGALMRAQRQVPLRVWLFGRDWNGGALVEHRYGAAA